MKLRRYDSFVERAKVDSNFELLNENLEKSKKFMLDNYILSTAVKSIGLANLLGKEKAEQIEYDMQEGNKKSLSPTDFAGIDTEKKKMLTDEMKSVKSKRETLLEGDTLTKLSNRVGVDINSLKSMNSWLSEYGPNDVLPHINKDGNPVEVVVSRLDDNTVKGLITTPEFKALRELSVEATAADGKTKEYVLDKDNIGWLSNFVYFYYVEGTDLEGLKAIYKMLIENSDLLPKLEIMEGVKLVKKPFDLNFINIRIPNNAEKLIDALNRLPLQRTYNKYYKDLPRHLRADLDKEPQIIKDKFAAVGEGFEGLFINPATEKRWTDKAKLEKADKDFKGFWGKMEKDTREGSKTFGQVVFMSPISRYQTITELIDNANGYLKALGNSNFESFYDKFNACNLQFGTAGAKEMFNAKGIFILEVKSFGANRVLNGHTTHCIKDSLSQWNNYVNMDRNRNFVEENKQYYIYNFNLLSSDPMWTIGATIEPDDNNGYLRAAHNKTDQSVASNLLRILNDWTEKYDIKEDATNKAKALGATSEEIEKYGPLYCIMRPISGDEFDRKKAQRQNNIEIVKPGLSIDRLKWLTIGGKDENGKVDPKSGGADVNREGDKKNSAALYNAVLEDDVEKAELLLNLGAMPNLFDNRRNAPISFAKSKEMIKLLVSRGSVLTPQVFGTICQDVETVEFCLKSGLDPNFENSFPLRASCKGSYKSANEPGEVFWDSFKLSLNYGASLVDETGNFWILKWAAEYGRIDLIDFVDKELEGKQGYVGAYCWMSMVRKRTPEDNKKTAVKLIELAEKYEPETWDALPDTKKWHLRR
jgi:hypothetical protein